MPETEYQPGDAEVPPYEKVLRPCPRNEHGGPGMVVSDLTAATHSHSSLHSFIQQIFTSDPTPPGSQRLPLPGDPFAFEVGNLQERDREMRYRFSHLRPHLCSAPPCWAACPQTP